MNVGVDQYDEAKKLKSKILLEKERERQRDRQIEIQSIRNEKAYKYDFQNYIKYLITTQFNNWKKLKSYQRCIILENNVYENNFICALLFTI